MKEYKVANVGKRIVAFLIDYFIYFLIIIFFSILFGDNEVQLRFSVKGLPAFILFLIGIYLWILSEVLFGQTIGKRVMNIKVVNISGRDIKTSQAILRFIFGIIDLMFLIGLIVSFLNKKIKELEI